MAIFSYGFSRRRLDGCRALQLCVGATVVSLAMVGCGEDDEPAPTSTVVDPNLPDAGDDLPAPMAPDDSTPNVPPAPPAPGPGSVDTGQLAFVVVEAESGTVGTDLSVVTSAGDTYVTADVNVLVPPGQVVVPDLGADAGADAGIVVDDRIFTVEAPLPLAGQYQLYVRFRIGPAAADDDSFFFDLGTEEAPNWLLFNNIGGNSTIGQAGYVAGAVVGPGSGDPSAGSWKWGFMPGATVNVDAESLTRTFRFATREDGLDIDQVAFAAVGADFWASYTADQFDAAEPGVPFPAQEVVDPVDASDAGVDGDASDAGEEGFDAGSEELDASVPADL